MIETHAHLNDPQFDGDRDQIIQRAFEAGVTKIIEIADSPADWDKALALAARYPGRIFCALGFHPHYALEWRESLKSSLRKSLESPKVVAIGEIGIDYAKSAAPPDVQAMALKEMLSIANESGKPIILHCREGSTPGAHHDLFEILKNSWRPPGRRRLQGVLHCFSGQSPEASQASSWPLALGVDGPVTYPKNDSLRLTLKNAGLHCLVLETDCPYLPPQTIRGRRNDPSRLTEIAGHLAEVFNMTSSQIAQATSQNASDLFGF